MLLGCKNILSDVLFCLLKKKKTNMELLKASRQCHGVEVEWQFLKKLKNGN